jgi:hypothetical protein
MRLNIPLILLCLLIGSCAKKVDSQLVVYDNNFESRNTEGLQNAQFTPFNGGTVLGNYNASGFSLQLNDLPEHDLIRISFDLYIHDTWDGNKLDLGPDLWELHADDHTLISATFSNDPCTPGYFCPPQSYPFNYPNSYNNPKTGAVRTDLPGLCGMQGQIGWTTQYHIEKTIRHSQKTLLLQCLDKLNQTTGIDSKCDESWSVDNVNVSAIGL